MENNQINVQNPVRNDELFEYEITAIGIELKGKFSKFNGDGLNIIDLNSTKLPVQLDNLTLSTKSNVEQVKVSVMPLEINFEYTPIKSKVESVFVDIPKVQTINQLAKIKTDIQSVSVDIPKIQSFKKIENIDSFKKNNFVSMETSLYENINYDSILQDIKTSLTQELNQ